MPAPLFIQKLLNAFPLVEYPEDLPLKREGYNSAPSKPTLWIYGPGIAGGKESFDVNSLRAQAECAFGGFETELRNMQIAEGAPGATLPTLHLPEGDLIPSAGISDWLAKRQAKEKSEGYTVDEDSEKKDVDEAGSLQARTFTSLVESKLQPALLAHLFLNPRTFSELTSPLYFPQTLSHGAAVQPPLTRLAFNALAKTYKLEMHAEIVKATQSGKTLDLEEVQRQGEEAIELLAAKLAEGGKGWFFGTGAPTTFDALLYANLYLILTLHAPHLDIASPLRSKLEKHAELVRWTKRLHKTHFQ